MFNTEANVPPAEIESRITRLQFKLQQQHLDGALLLQNCDRFYFSGTIQQSHLYVPAVGDPILMVRKSFERALAESPLETIIPLTSPRSIPQILKSKGLALPMRLGMELDVLPFNLFKNYEYIFNGPETLDISPELRMLRAVKSPYELEIITRAAGLSDQLAAFAAQTIQAGMTELELAGLVEGHARKLGHQGIIRMRLWGAELFYGHLMAGASAAVPSYLASPTGGSATSPAVAQGAGFARIAADQPILLDYAFVLNGYISDHTRIFALESLPEDLLRAHEAMLGIQARIKEEATPGVSAGYLYDLAVHLAIEAGYADHFMGAEDQRIRFIGHGVGLELDELPVLAKGQELPLQENMVIALEPKLIFPGRGVVGIENTHVVTKFGLRQLGRYPDDVVIITR